MADSKKYNGSTWEHSLRKLTTATDTLTTLPVDIYADGNTATVGLKGNTVQSGTPSPDMPVDVVGCGDRTGNLFDESNFALVQVTSTAYRYGTSLGVLSQGTYTFNATKSAGAQSIYLTAKLNGVYSQTTISSVPFSFTADGDSEYIIRTANNTGTTWEAENYSDMMLNTGSQPLPYEPYGYKIPISSAGQTTPVYLGQVQTTRNIKKLELTGQETGYKRVSSGGRSIFYLDTITPDYLRSNDITLLCSHYKAIAGVTGASDVGEGETSLFKTVGVNQRLYFGDNNYSSVEDFTTYLAQQYLAGTPVTVWYVLAEPTTGIVNEPLMKIGTYADEVSVITIPVTAGANTLSVGTTVQPSEVTVNYKGWHAVADVHEAENGQWD